MIDVVGAFNDLVTQWQDEARCGLCWQFTAPMRESDLNEYQFRTEQDACCILVAITNYRFRCRPVYNQTSMLLTHREKVTTFDVSFLAQDDLGLNVYNEIPNHELAESKWATILKPIEDCVGCHIVDICEPIFQGATYNITRDAIQRIDWLDSNYTGYTFTIQFTEQIENI